MKTVYLSDSQIDDLIRKYEDEKSQIETRMLEVINILAQLRSQVNQAPAPQQVRAQATPAEFTPPAVSYATEKADTPALIAEGSTLPKATKIEKTYSKQHPAIVSDSPITEDKATDTTYVERESKKEKEVAEEPVAEKPKRRKYKRRPRKEIEDFIMNTLKEENKYLGASELRSIAYRRLDVDDSEQKRFDASFANTLSKLKKHEGRIVAHDKEGRKGSVYGLPSWEKNKMPSKKDIVAQKQATLSEDDLDLLNM
ncbi:MAG: hypothetical protein JJT94_00370 [Bernardetiaceae bacterium]|nr:hypothetical protein [Bernardetiaceae bacterium]